MKPIPFGQRLVVRLAVGMISVALLSLFLTFALQVVNVTLSDLRPPEPDRMQELLTRLLAENPNDEDLLALTEFPYELRRVLLTTTLLSVIVSGGLWIYLAIRFARSIARPIEQVTSAAAKITGGDLSARVDVPSGSSGETARLSEHFNQMARSLETYERERTEMIAAIAHELRTPLAVMLARLEVMEAGLVELSQEEVSRLGHQAKLLTRLVNDLRTLSLADANRLSLYKQKVDLGDLVRRATESFSGRAREAVVSLSTEIADVWATVDPDRLEQVLFNLLDNAFKHTPAGGRVTVSLDASAGQVRLAVRDTGTGFGGDPKRLFGRFYKAHDDLGGSGLGLALVKVLIESHGGSVSAKNNPDGGASFEVRF
ncbi:MAG: hypothetical protein AVDCRST_MAG86-3092 [uncultured Truepera sp.]|uniref:histidine kinase n=1 Tax=uncultured Truepera sp. TaxID=543023 RepID=A0A6J4VNC8_9DEIN|nr:MAG: hypothetical protein AVDCRST_MAG86-3092 [uncultured Truepera sp.]